MNGPGESHTSRLFATDINHDGHLDVLAGHSMWIDGRDDWPSALQVLLNDGTGRPTDKTAALNPSMKLDIASLDFTPIMVDLDGSGIDTFIFAGGAYTMDPARQSNYVLLNDGTGRMHVGMHDEFHALSAQVKSFVKTQFRESDGFRLGGYAQNADTVLKFFGVPQRDGTLEVIAQTEVIDFRDAANYQVLYVHTNVETSYNPSVDFTQDVIIEDRNDSQLIRTWAGNDTIYEWNAAAETSINGGLGFDTVVYASAFSDTKVTRTDGGFRVERVDGGIDSLVGIERLAFPDQIVELPSTLGGFNPFGIYRFFNEATGTHFYTASVHEAEGVVQSLPTYRLEGVAFDRADNAGATTVNVHRFYNEATDVHFYTAVEEEVAMLQATAPQFLYEGVAYQAHGEKIDGTTELYRFYNEHTGTHFYTANAQEMESVRVELAGSFNFEGVAFYVDIA